MDMSLATALLAIQAGGDPSRYDGFPMRSALPDAPVTAPRAKTHHRRSWRPWWARRTR